MKTIIAALILLYVMASAMAENQKIVNPFTKIGLWELTQEDCQGNKQMGTIRGPDGRAIGCWLGDNHPVANNTIEATFIIGGQVYSFPLAVLAQDIRNYNAWMESVAIGSLNNRPTPNRLPNSTIFVNPPATTNYYNNLGFPIGSSNSY